MGLELGNDKETKRLFARLDKAIEFLEDEEFIGIITMHYLDKLTMERIAEIYDISLVTAYAQKKKMIKKIANIALSDDVIKEILSE
jgi:DNA-directed RNA polymerase specialized sigma subunit